MGSFPSPRTRLSGPCGLPSVHSRAWAPAASSVKPALPAGEASAAAGVPRAPASPREARASSLTSGGEALNVCPRPLSGCVRREGLHGDPGASSSLPSLLQPCGARRTGASSPRESGVLQLSPGLVPYLARRPQSARGALPPARPSEFLSASREPAPRRRQTSFPPSPLLLSLT